MRRIDIASLLLSFSMASAATAGDRELPKGVVELFTSQGCSSCPPADRMIEALAMRPDVIALAYHVDYWNYLGWADTLSSPENTARQYAYAQSLGRSGVYTPQAVINGRDHMVGGDLAGLTRGFDAMRAAGNGLTIPVETHRQGADLAIEIGAGKGRADILLVRFKRQETVNVLRGENRGHRISYWNSVTRVETVGSWSGSTLRLAVPAERLESGGNDGYAILLQTSGPKGTPSAILGAAIIVPAKEG